MPIIFVDADACPVKQEVCRVAQRFDLDVVFVANTRMRIPEYQKARLIVVNNQFDAADKWITEHCGTDDVVVTADILLADSCIKKGAAVLGSTGKEFTEDSIGTAVAMKDLMSELRQSGLVSAGPAPFNQKDRSRFLQMLDQIIQRIKNKK